MKLIVPSLKFKKDYYKAINESKDETGITVIAKPLKDQSFEEFVKNKIDQSNGINLPQGYVPNTELWLIDNNEFVGTANIRHFLNDHLLKIGGHIAYWIRPSKRKMGYGKKILKLALLKSKKMGINNALVTCDDTNTGSRKIIESSGGILENIVENGKENPPKRRYWITI